MTAWTAARRRKAAETMRRTVKSASWKRGHQEAMARRAKDPVWRKTARDRLAQAKASPEYAAKMSRVYSSPEWKRSHTAQLDQLHADPVAQQRLRDSITRRSRDPKWREAIALRSTNPEWRRKNAAWLDRLHADPAIQERRFRALARALSRHPNRPEKVLRATLRILKVGNFRVEVPFPDRSRADVVVGKIVGEFDGGGHFARGRERVLALDALKDARRRALGYTVIRDNDPVRLAVRIYLAANRGTRA